MVIRNYTKHEFPYDWYEDHLKILGVEPVIYIYNKKKNNPENRNVMFGHEFSGVDGIAFFHGKICVYRGCWRDKKFIDWTDEYFRWVILHELRHQYYYKKRLSGNYKWSKYDKKDGPNVKEEQACNDYANRYIGKREKDFKIFDE